MGLPPLQARKPGSNFPKDPVGSQETNCMSFPQVLDAKASSTGNCRV
jgi:hypothetical protein